MTDLDLVMQAIQRDYPVIPPPVHNIWTASAAAKVIDCVLSLNRDYYGQVLPRVNAFVAAKPEISSLRDLRTLIDSYPSPYDFLEAELRLRFAARATILSQIIDFLLEELENYPGGNDQERLERWAADARPGDYIATGVRGFALSGFQYLRMLFGAQTTKPDIHIIRFVSEAIGRTVTDIQALYLMERAARRLDIPLRNLDALIWEQRAGTPKP
jgi:hypothetical protein